MKEHNSSRVICDTDFQLPNAIQSHAGILLQQHFDHSDLVHFKGISCILNHRSHCSLWAAGPRAPCQGSGFWVQVPSHLDLGNSVKNLDVFLLSAFIPSLLLSAQG